jgi:hypothetical protein
LRSKSRSYLKKVFWPNLGVGAGFQILDRPAYACGLKPGSAYVLNQNPFFEMASNQAPSHQSKCISGYWAAWRLKNGMLARGFETTSFQPVDF